jgi:membrane protease YdiL (CAAX protease family)
MTRLKAFIARHPVASYFGVTFVISWGGALLAIGGSGAMRGTTPTSDARFTYALITMLAGPSLTGILMTTLVYGRTGRREFLTRLLAWRVGAIWYAVALLTAPVVMTMTLLALSSASPAFLPGIFTTADQATLLLVSLAVGVSAGIFEELGWTGFAIPTLRRRYGVLVTGLIVGILWSAWHLLPNVWASRAASGELAMPAYFAGTAVAVFVGYLTAFRVLMVWLYDHTQSLFVAMLMHVSLTASLLILNPLDISGANLWVFSFAFAAALWVVVVVIALRSDWHLERRALRRSRWAASAGHGAATFPSAWSVRTLSKPTLHREAGAESSLDGPGSAEAARGIEAFRVRVADDVQEARSAAACEIGAMVDQ